MMICPNCGEVWETRRVFQGAVGNAARFPWPRRLSAAVGSEPELRPPFVSKSLSAPGQAWARRKDDVVKLKPRIGTQRVSNPAWQSWPAARTQSCVVPGRPGLRSVDREFTGRVMEPRNFVIAEADTFQCVEGSTRESKWPDCRVSPGSKSRACAQGVPQEPGRPCRFRRHQGG
jgi:hypothetical protein